MSHCTTWHIRIDLVDDGTEIASRAALVGAPAAMSRRSSSGAHDGYSAGCRGIDYLTSWRPLTELTLALIDALAHEHLAGDPSPSRASRS